jgi:hypothetical protein
VRLHARGNFFGEQFEKQIGHGISGPAGRGLLLASPPVHVTAYQPPPPPPPPPPPEPPPPDENPDDPEDAAGSELVKAPVAAATLDETALARLPPEKLRPLLQAG